MDALETLCEVSKLTLAHLPCLRGFEQQPSAGALLSNHQVVVDSPRGQQCWDGHPFGACSNAM